MIPDLKNKKVELEYNTEKVMYVNQTALVDHPRQYLTTRDSTLVPLLHPLVPESRRLFHIPPFNISDDAVASLQRDKLLIRAVVVQKLASSKINYQQLRASLLNNDNSVIKVRE